MGFNNRGYNRGFGGYPTNYASFPTVYEGYGGYRYGGTLFSQNPCVNVNDEVGRYEDVDNDIMGPSFNDFAIDDSAASVDSVGGGGDYGGSSY